MKSPAVPNAETVAPRESVSGCKASLRRVIWLLFPVGILAAAIVGLHVAARPAPTTFHVAQAIAAGRVPVRGVNLGGWLVAEQWMSPRSDIWKDLPANATWTEVDAAAAYASAAAGVKGQLGARFEAHRKSWITESDIAAIAAANFNTIRIPVGYWIGGATTNSDTKSSLWATFAPGALAYLDTAVQTWAPKYNLSVLIDLYATMNGNHWPDPGDTKVPLAKYNTTLNTTIFLATRYAKAPALLGIGLLSTPDDSAHFRSLLYYYMNAYRNVRGLSESMVVTTCASRSFQRPGDVASVMSEDKTFMNFLINPDLPEKITHAWHEWQLLPGMNDTALASDPATWAARIDGWKSHEPLFIGAWTLGVGANASAPTTPADKQALAAKLVPVVNKAPRGWVYANWKVADSTRGWGWSLQDVLQDGVKLP
ncbi:hypothetical protein SDRG_09692 [Saprolegnia diclina VS20]|uniref:glucan 1,3-beta-glucosidase n=1 Tax=Saprolegnia diclina (strain VS20) TaxID=1156394 RepID=T0QD98_SAPDV|nr:hypothetical protein SDRG_09692 [Saprolegnia diclina VS20]EQC32721.1 hypothetical protein SDRG_09692 [Saprolegnia diclina VS20]|eukprot:XP_008613865.1 hypothetical protein SDRG_09692 [Saprolegnia diclina VS20]